MAELTHVNSDGPARHRSPSHPHSTTPSASDEAPSDEPRPERSFLDDPLLTPIATEDDIHVSAELAQVRIENARITPASRLVFYRDADGPGADRFRFLRMKLREYWALGKLRTLLITSPEPGDGKSTIALNLATALAEKGKKTVLLVEADQHRPALASALGLEPGPGLAECLADRVDPLQVLRRIEPLHFYLLRAGQPRQNRTELLEADTLGSLMKSLRRTFDWVLIDTPPVIPLADTLVLARHADAALLVVRADKTPRESVEESLSLLGPKRVLGIVLNGAESLNRVYSKYYSHYKPQASSETVADKFETGDSASAGS